MTDKPLISRLTDADADIDVRATVAPTRAPTGSVRSLGDDAYRSAMLHSPIGMALALPDGRWMEVNRAFCAIVGSTREDMLGPTPPAFTHPEDLDADALHRRQLLNRELESYQVEQRCLGKDGRTIWVQLNASLVLDEERRPQYFVFQVQDVTERRRIAADLVALNRRYARHAAALTILARSSVSRRDDLPAVLRGVTAVVARTLEVARVGVWRLDERGTSLRCDDLFEWPASHVAGMEMSQDECPELFQSLSDGAAGHAAQRDPLMGHGGDDYLRRNGVTAVLSAPIREQGVTVGVLSCEHIGDARRWTSDEQTFVFSVANLVTALIGQVERRHLEDQLRQAQKLEAIGQLAGGIAHDFNNILTVILGKATPIAEDSRLPADVREASADVVRSGERAAALTRQLLAFSRRQAMQTRVVDLNAVVADIARMLPRVVGEDVSIRFLYGAGPVQVLADAGMIDQVLLNLAVNARDAMRGGGQLTVETSRLDVDEAAAARRAGARPGAFACLLVRDTGSGISADHLPHIFEPFFTTKDVGKGTGLGLATTYGIVQQHEGWIEVESDVGVGTTFRVFLPLTTTPELMEVKDPRDATPARVSHPRGSETILVVEDEDAVRELVLDVLVRSGYTVLSASNGRQALGVWRSHGAGIDLLLTDVVMPGGMNGFELARRLRLENPGLAVVFTSGYSADTHDEGHVLRHDVNFLSKPYTLPKLAQVVRRSLDDLDARSTAR
jgi:PAS domain S-box-containing protein